MCQACVTIRTLWMPAGSSSAALSRAFSHVSIDRVSTHCGGMAEIMVQAGRHDAANRRAAGPGRPTRDGERQLGRAAQGDAGAQPLERKRAGRRPVLAVARDVAAEDQHGLHPPRVRRGGQAGF